jgi:hypothetical protein
MFYLFWIFLDEGRLDALCGSAVVAGAAFSCKFTTVVFPPILALVWWVNQSRCASRAERFRLAIKAPLGLALYMAILFAADFAITGFALLPLSQRTGDHPTIPACFGGAIAGLLAGLYETPLPQDWVGLVTQLHHQATGGSSYLLGETRDNGWSYYYLVALAVKTPLSFWLLVFARTALAWRKDETRRLSEMLLPLTTLFYLAITAIGSTRNYGMRYLLPVAPLVIVWVSRLAEPVLTSQRTPARWPSLVIGIALAGQALAIASVHPFELTYFNTAAGGPQGGRHILSDSNLDWGQGLNGLARLQRAEPEFRDVTLYYFGNTDPAWYEVTGKAYVVNAVDGQAHLPAIETVKTGYLAVSASLQWGPWGPPRFFDQLGRITPVRMTDDTTIAIYRADDVRGKNPLSQLRTQGKPK